MTTEFLGEIHSSLYGDLALQLTTPLPSPVCAIFDHHMHASGVFETRAYVTAARAYGVTRAVGLTRSVETASALEEAFPGFFVFCGWPEIYDVEENRHWLPETIEIMEAQAAAGFVAMKFKIVPDRDGRRPRIWLDDKRLRPIFEFCESRGLAVQAHIAQPDAWFDKYYEPARAGRKEEYFDQVEHVVARYPRMPYVGVHIGGWPENLDYLERMMRTYPNFHVDTSATKWTVRELSRQRDRAREFFVRNADRILFGSDLVVQKAIAPTYYTSRFHVQRTMWETGKYTPSMIKDPDSAEAPVIHGLDLPEETLRKVYWENAVRVFSL